MRLKGRRFHGHIVVGGVREPSPLRALPMDDGGKIQTINGVLLDWKLGLR